ncbi:MAG: hypothetical protein SXQ77_11185 [Halobacteria archaeon]|nr:hypothetical protein [Halobacteria archaeon]
MISLSKPAVFGAGFVVGVLVVLVGVALVFPAEINESPTYTVTTATGCSPTNDSVTQGWIAQIPAGDSVGIAVNYTFIHSSAEVDVEAELTERSNRQYVLELESTPAEGEGERGGEKPAPPQDCQPRTTVEVTTTLSRDYNSFSVFHNGTEITSVENNGETQLRNFDSSNV